MPAGRGHCLQTESDSFLSVPENSAAQLAQEVRLLQEGSPERLFWPPLKDHEQPLDRRGTAGESRVQVLLQRAFATPVSVDPGEETAVLLHRMPQSSTPAAGHHKLLPLTLSPQGSG